MRHAIIDIETRIDKHLCHRVFFPDAPDPEEAYLRLRGNLNGGFFPVTLHVPISIGWGEVNADHVLESVECLAGGAASEQGLVEAFWARMRHFQGCLVTFNGRRFDLPVLELHALRQGLSAPAYFAGRGAADRHLDLFEFLTDKGAIGLRGGLNLLLKAIGLPGKGAIEGSQVQELYEAGRLGEIHRYCRSDVIQTYYLFLRVELMRGRLSPARYERALELTAAFRAELEG